MAQAGNNTFIKKIYPVTQGTSSNVICYNPVTGDINYKLDSGGTILPDGNEKGDYIFWNGAWVLGDTNISLGGFAGFTGQGTNAVAIGTSAGSTGQGVSAVAIGYHKRKSEEGKNLNLTVTRYY